MSQVLTIQVSRVLFYFVKMIVDEHVSGMGWRALFQIQAEEPLSGSTPAGGLIPTL